MTDIGGTVFLRPQRRVATSVQALTGSGERNCVREGEAMAIALEEVAAYRQVRHSG